MNANEIADRLDGAAAYGEEHGWCAGMQEDRDGRVCIIGAILRSFGLPAVTGVMVPYVPIHACDAEISQAAVLATKHADDAARSLGADYGPGYLRPAANYSDTHSDAERAALLRKAAQLARQQAPVGVEVNCG